MKNLLKTIPLLVALFCFSNIQAQTAPSSSGGNTINQENSFFLSPRAGYDFPFFNNNTPFIDYKGGLELGASADYYWNWFGLGFDFDYIKNQPRSTYDYNNLINPITSTLITGSNLTEDNITRMFYGIGPDYRWYSNSGRFTAELNTRIGLSGIKGGRVMEIGMPGGDTLNFHAGYNFKNKLASKLQVRATYYFNDYIGLNAGVYYIQHFYGQELSENGLSAAYQGIQARNSTMNEYDGILTQRQNACNCDISSVGVFAGITVKIPTKGKKSAIPEDYSLIVTARDKFTKEVLPNTDVAVKNLAGEVIATGTTNNYGVVVFNNIKPDDYTIDGILNEVALDPSSAAKSEFIVNQTLQKEVIYSDEDFILQGNAVVCNTTEGIPGVKVKLQNKSEGVQKSTMTDKTGKYIFHVKQNKTYTLSGKKDKYFSQVETIETSDFDRNTTLFVKLEICMEKVDCGEALNLRDIQYDLDKFYLRNEAKIELDRLVLFMKDYPAITVELSSHTDSQGSDSYNMSLSQQRADAAVDYMVSQGIARTRLTGRGYGETQLLNNCANGVNCSKSQHQINRRTEMKVICPN